MLHPYFPTTVPTICQVYFRRPSARTRRALPERPVTVATRRRQRSLSRVAAEALPPDAPVVDPMQFLSTICPFLPRADLHFLVHCCSIQGLPCITYCAPTQRRKAVGINNNNYFTNKSFFCFCHHRWFPKMQKKKWSYCSPIVSPQNVFAIIKTR